MSIIKELRKNIIEAPRKGFRNHKYLLLILLVSFLAKLIYIFHYSDYKNYLFSDMGGYWGRAQERYEGGVFNLGQWTSWATFFHFYLTEIFKILNHFHLFKYRLEIVIILNIIYSTLSVYYLYFIALQIIKNTKYSLLTTFFYAFSYPIFYYNAFVLSENLSIPIVIISTYLVFTYHESGFKMFLTGLLFAIATAARPILGLLALPFFLYIVFAKKFSSHSFKKAVIFALGFFLIIYIVVQENIRISNGELKNLSGNGGVNFFIQQCKVQWVQSTYHGHVVVIGPGTYLGYPELARMKFATDHPFHDQKYFYALGLQCIRNNPRIWLDNILPLKALLLGPLFPGVLSAKGFEYFYKLSNKLIMLMISTFWFLYFLIRDKKIEIKKLLLLLSILFCIIVTNYFFATEQRYCFPAYFVIYLLFFTILKNYFKEAKIYLITSVLLYLLFFN